MADRQAERPAAAARGRDTRSRFDRFVEFAQRQVSRPGAFAVAIAVVLAWAISFPLFHEIAEWHAVIHSAASVTTLLILVLLENAGRRSDEAAQEKLNLVCEALTTLLDERAAGHPADSDEQAALREQADRLRDAVGLEARH